MHHSIDFETEAYQWKKLTDKTAYAQNHGKRRTMSPAALAHFEAAQKRTDNFNCVLQASCVILTGYGERHQKTQLPFSSRSSSGTDGNPSNHISAVEFYSHSIVSSLLESIGANPFLSPLIST
jgi:hypothetical protein